jgi:hypothetical protein
MMLVTYRFLGFVRSASDGDVELLEYPGGAVRYPDFVRIRTPEAAGDGTSASGDRGFQPAHAGGRG